jgi:two-component system, LuxR family, sensor kinase FixL
MSEPGENNRMFDVPGEEHSLLAAIANSSNDAIIGKDLHGIVLYWNAAAERLFGLPAEAMIGQPVTRIIPPGRIEEEMSILRRVGEGVRLEHFETERLGAEGRIIPVSLTISPIRDAAGAVVGLSNVIRDLSETQRLNNELHQRGALLDAILKSVPDGLVVIDERGCVQFFSPSAERMFGYAAEEIIGHNVSMLMPEPYAQAHDLYLARYKATGERRIIGIGRVVAGRRKDGTTFPMELQIGEAHTPGDRRFTGFVRDLTDREERDRRVTELQAELMHAARVSELGQMVSALAHEVNQPLTAITNYLRGTRRLLDSAGTPLIRDTIDKVIVQAERARTIVQSVRGLVRKQPQPRAVEDLESVILETSALALAGTNRAIDLDLRLAADANRAFIDRVQIQQVLLNLMRNAVEAMNTSAIRKLSVTTGRRDDRIEVVVADTGHGLSDAVRMKIFEPFVTTKAEGLGVGLSISRAIVESHGGELKVESASGEGTTFRFTIPLAAPVDEAHAPPL